MFFLSHSVQGEQAFQRAALSSELVFFLQLRAALMTMYLDGCYKDNMTKVQQGQPAVCLLNI